MSLIVPIIDVHRDNFKDFWPAINLAIQTASFIAIDAELSGLGCRRNLMAKSIEDRYKSISEVAKTRSILSLGLSCFKLLDQDSSQDSQEEQKPNSQKFLAQTFNILTLCNEDYMVEPGALQFLVGHGFDFNKQYSRGIPYYRGLDKKDDKAWPSLRLLFNHILAAKKPLTLHNGLVDLVFLYQNLYTDLPPSCAQFTADLSEMYAGGLIDTKYVAEYEARMTASYLEYVFRKSQRENAVRKMNGASHAVLDFCQYSSDMPAVEYQTYALPPDFTERHKQGTTGNKSTDICEIYAAHGCCAKGVRCPKSHDPNAILDAEDIIIEEKRKRKRRKRNRKNQSKNVEMTDGETDGKKVKYEEGKDVEDQEEERMDLDRTGTDMKRTDEVEMGNENGTDTGTGTDTANGTGNSIASSGMDVEKEQESQVESKAVDVGQNGTRFGAFQQKPLVTKKTGSHRAGFDAFMTGFATATFMARFGSKPKNESVIGKQGSVAKRLNNGQSTGRVGLQSEEASVVERFSVGHLTSKLYLSGKDYPLAIAKSSFTKTSNLHRDKMEMIEKLAR